MNHRNHNTPMSKPQHSTIKNYFDVEQFQPTGDLVLVERVVEAAPLILIPDSAQQREQKCVVIAVGPGRMSEFGILMKPCCNVGAVVFTHPQKFFGIELSGRKLMLLNSQDILGVFRAEKQQPAIVGTLEANA